MSDIPWQGVRTGMIAVPTRSLRRTNQRDLRVARTACSAAAAEAHITAHSRSARRSSSAPESRFYALGLRDSRVAADKSANERTSDWVGAVGCGAKSERSEGLNQRPPPAAQKPARLASSIALGEGWRGMGTACRLDWVVPNRRGLKSLLPAILARGRASG